ncbi:hypothetical protein DFH29DRAFT_871633 [Suillus ampliporus]|nr:hypothetical protein DFH29DRAFT_871633 [Suillus ampliporus]
MLILQVFLCLYCNDISILSNGTKYKNILKPIMLVSCFIVHTKYTIRDGQNVLLKLTEFVRTMAVRVLGGRKQAWLQLMYCALYRIPGSKIRGPEAQELADPDGNQPEGAGTSWSMKERTENRQGNQSWVVGIKMYKAEGQRKGLFYKRESGGLDM